MPIIVTCPACGSDALEPSATLPGRYVCQCGASFPASTAAMRFQPHVSALPAWQCLSPREQQLLALIGQGKHNKEIAAELGVTANTVRAHAQGLFNKLGVESRLEAVLRAQELGLLTPPGSWIPAPATWAPSPAGPRLVPVEPVTMAGRA